MKLAEIKTKKRWYLSVKFVVNYFSNVITKRNNEKRFRKENEIRNRINIYCPKCYSTDVTTIETAYNSVNAVVCTKCGYKFKHCN